MKRLSILIVVGAWGLAGCSSSGTHHVADGGGDATPLLDAAAPDAARDGHPDATPDAACDGCTSVAGSLAGLAWLLPCTSAHSATSCDTTATATASTTVAGTTGVTYDVTVHLRGVVEQRTYATSCADGSAVAGGATSASDPFNIYELDISAPPQRLYVNPGTSAINLTGPLDYSLAFRADAGATITLRADSIDAGEIFNHDATGAPVSVSGTSVTQPFDGQFIEMSVDTVVPDPIASGATVGSGSAGFALQLAGAQVATVADAPSLEPVDVTTEGWFIATGLPGTYNCIFSKLLGTGTAESYTIWVQDGALRSGVDLDSVTGSTAFPFAPVDGLWHHVASTFDAASRVTTLYLDGSAMACSVAPGGITYDAQALLLGGDVDNGVPSGFWQGALDELRVFSVARSADQIWADMHTHRLGPTAGLVGEWTFDEGSGQTSADTSGLANGAVFGSTTAVEGNDPSWVGSTVPH